MSEPALRRDVIAILLELSRCTPTEEIRLGGSTLKPIDVTNAIRDALELVTLVVDSSKEPDLRDAHTMIAAADDIVRRFSDSPATVQNMDALRSALHAVAPEISQLASSALNRLLGPAIPNCGPTAYVLVLLCVVSFGALAVKYPVAGWLFFGGLFLGVIGLEIWIGERRKSAASLASPLPLGTLTRQAARTIEWWVGKSIVERTEREGVATLAMLFVTGILIFLRWGFDWDMVAVWIVAAMYAAFMIVSMWEWAKGLCTTRRFMTSPLFVQLDLRISRILLHGGEDLTTNLGALLLVAVVAKLTVLLWLASHL